MVWLVVLVPGGIYGWLVATLASYAVLLVAGLLVLGHRWTGSFEWRHLRFALAFGLPLLPHAISHWALSLSYRAVLGAFVSPNEVGVYNLAYQLPPPISINTVALHQGVMPLYAHASAEASVRRESSIGGDEPDLRDGVPGLGRGSPRAAFRPDRHARRICPRRGRATVDWMGPHRIRPVPDPHGRDHRDGGADTMGLDRDSGRGRREHHPQTGRLTQVRHAGRRLGYGDRIPGVALVAIYGYMLRVTDVPVLRRVDQDPAGDWHDRGLPRVGYHSVTPGGSPEAAFVIRSLILVVALIVMWRIACWHRSYDAGRPLRKTTP